MMEVDDTNLKDDQKEEDEKDNKRFEQEFKDFDDVDGVNAFIEYDEQFLLFDQFEL